jgi:hypothetical protein
LPAAELSHAASSTITATAAPVTAMDVTTVTLLDHHDPPFGSRPPVPLRKA